ncbi:MAG TPA: hypothetical protein ENO20_09175 [Bacteroides sp.]|nr:hypothetical protein [Bacteroides sp.]
MKKIAAIICLAIFSLPALKAQESTFNLGDQVVNIGIGLGSVYAIGSYYTTTVPPISISYEKAIVDEILEKGVIGVGGYVGYTSYKYHYIFSTYDYGWKYTNIILGARGNFHYPLVDKLDTYLGMLMGYNIRIAKEFGTFGTDVNPDRGSLALAGYLGARYYFSEKFAAFAELGYGISYLTLGISLKL